MILTLEPDRRVDLDAVVADLIDAGDLARALIITPTKRKVRALRRELAERTAIEAANVETLGGLAERLALAEFVEYELADETAVVSLLRARIDNDNIRLLETFRSGAREGALIGMAAAIEEYARHGVESERLREAARTLEPARKRNALDFADLYADFRRALEEARLLLTGDCVAKLNALSRELFEARLAESYPDANLALVFGYTAFAAPEVDFLARIAKTRGRRLYLRFDYRAFNRPLFGALEETHKTLTERGFREAKDVSPASAAAFENALRERLFARGEPTSRFADRATVLVARDEREEVESIVSEIRRLLTQENVPPNEIAVAYRDAATYPTLLRAAARKFGVPLDVTERRRLSESPAVAALVAALEVVSSDYDYAALRRVLANPRLNLPASPDDLRRVALEHKTTRGKARWRDKVRDAIEKTEDGADRERLRRVAESVSILDEALAPFEKALDAEAFARELRGAAKRLGLTSHAARLRGEEAELNARGLARALDETRRRVPELERMFGDEPRPLAFTLDRIRLLFANARFSVREREGAAVTATTPDELRNLSFKRLFAVGLTSERWPPAYHPPAYLGDDPARLRRRRLQEERYLWYQTIAASRERFHASYPEKDARGETTPSAFLLALERVAKIERRRPDKSVAEAAIGRKHDAGNLGLVERLSGKARAAFAWKVEGAYSASRLETYARCPKKYFYQYILRLDEGREPSEEPAPLDVGTLAHEILAEFYEDDAVNDALRSDAPSALFEEAADRLFAIAERRVAESGFDAGFSPSVERLTGIDGDRRRSILGRFLEHERSADDGFRAVATERRFGYPGTPPFRAGEVELRGAIDRIDRNATRRLIRAIDYKTGAAPSADDYEKGLALQLPLYAAAARAETGDDPAPPAIFSLRYNEEAFGLKPLGGGRRPLDLDEERDAAVESANDAIRRATRLASEFVADIRAGRFPYSKLERRETRACAFCLYRGICRVEEQTDSPSHASNFRTEK